MATTPAHAPAASSAADLIGSLKTDLDTPALVLDLDVMERNVARMARTFRDAGVGWRPHTKAIKVPTLAHKLIAAGALGVTCAKLGEAEVMADAGIRDILIANQIVGETKIARLVALARRADIIVAVDSPDNVRALDAAASAAAVRPRVVIEVDIGMRRAGVQPGAATVELGRQVHACAGLRLAGLMAWEGHTVGIRDVAEKQRAIASAIALLTETAEACRAAGLPMDVVSCGGTGTYAYTARLPGITELQAGGGIFCDVYYHDVMQVDHEYALTVLTTVTSRPTPTRIICDAGKKTMSSDAALPRPLIDAPVQKVALSAEHVTVELASAAELASDAELAVGDKLEFIVGYSDTTTMLHEELYAVRKGRVEAIWPVLGRGKLR
jgi:D-serine deaminase-like pyridoxal phosphate-dependent protein